MILLIGYGNETRGDDALGPIVAQRLGTLGLPGLEVRIAHQLLPEMALALAGAELAIFVDAVSTGMAVQIRPVRPIQSAWGTHYGTPDHLLGLTRELYGTAPPALVFEVAGSDFGFRFGLSEPAARHAEEAVLRIERTVHAHLRSGSAEMTSGPWAENTASTGA